MKRAISTLMVMVLGLGSLVRPAAADCAGGATSLAGCLQCCFDQLNDNLEACKESCEYCTKWIFFGLLCSEWATNAQCLSNCQDDAKGVSDACKAGCYNKFPNIVRVPYALLPEIEDGSGGGFGGLLLTGGGGGDF